MIFDPNASDFVEELEINKPFIEPFTEEKIAVDYKNSICIGIFPRDSYTVAFLNDPYFKVFNNTNINKATAVARISLLQPVYIHHSNSRKLSDFTLSRHDKNILIDILESPSTIGGKRYNNAWEGMCEYLGKLSKGYFINVDYKYLKDHMPNYLDL